MENVFEVAFAAAVTEIHLWVDLDFFNIVVSLVLIFSQLVIYQTLRKLCDLSKQVFAYLTVD